jgi:hypothetical protein
MAVLLALMPAGAMAEGSNAGFGYGGNYGHDPYPKAGFHFALTRPFGSGIML